MVLTYYTSACEKVGRFGLVQLVEHPNSCGGIWGCRPAEGSSKQTLATAQYVSWPVLISELVERKGYTLQQAGNL